MSAAAEAAVKKLARAPGNTECPNCGLAKKFGFGTVCMKYLTFVCNECKSSHQAISHRCKSLTMSAWSDDEVASLQHQGGNDRARQTWLATAPPFGQQGRPLSNGTSSIDTYKAFIVNVYERKMYYQEGGGKTNRSSTAGSGTMATPVPTATAASAPPTRRFVAPAPSSAPTLVSAAPRPRVAPLAAAAPAAPVADLLDFGSSAPVTASAAAASISNTNSAILDPFNGRGNFAFGDFSGTTNSVSTDVPAAVAAAAPAPAVPIFDPFSTSAPNPLTASTAATTTSFDPFGNSSSTTNSNSATVNGSSVATNGVTKKPIMNGGSTGAALAQQVPTMGGGMGGMGNMHSVGSTIMMNMNSMGAAAAAGMNPMWNSSMTPPNAGAMSNSFGTMNNGPFNNTGMMMPNHHPANSNTFGHMGNMMNPMMANSMNNNPMSMNNPMMAMGMNNPSNSNNAMAMMNTGMNAMSFNTGTTNMPSMMTNMAPPQRMNFQSNGATVVPSKPFGASSSSQQQQHTKHDPFANLGI